MPWSGTTDFPANCTAPPRDHQQSLSPRSSSRRPRLPAVTASSSSARHCCCFVVCPQAAPPVYRRLLHAAGWSSAHRCLSAAAAAWSPSHRRLSAMPPPAAVAWSSAHRHLSAVDCFPPPLPPGRRRISVSPPPTASRRHLVVCSSQAIDSFLTPCCHAPTSGSTADTSWPITHRRLVSRRLLCRPSRLAPAMSAHLRPVARLCSSTLMLTLTQYVIL